MTALDFRHFTLFAGIYGILFLAYVLITFTKFGLRLQSHSLSDLGELPVSRLRWRIVLSVHGLIELLWLLSLTLFLKPSGLGMLGMVLLYLEAIAGVGCAVVPKSKSMSVHGIIASFGFIGGAMGAIGLGSYLITSGNLFQGNLIVLLGLIVGASIIFSFWKLKAFPAVFEIPLFVSIAAINFCIYTIV